MAFIIFRCRKCGRYLYARTDQKSRRCVCGYTNKLNRVVIVKKVKDEKMAGEIVRELQERLKSKNGFKRFG